MVFSLLLSHSFNLPFLLFSQTSHLSLSLDFALNLQIGQISSSSSSFGVGVSGLSNTFSSFILSSLFSCLIKKKCWAHLWDISLLRSKFQFSSKGGEASGWFAQGEKGPYFIITFLSNNFKSNLCTFCCKYF